MTPAPLTGERLFAEVEARRVLLEPGTTTAFRDQPAAVRAFYDAYAARLSALENAIWAAEERTRFCGIL